MLKPRKPYLKRYGNHGSTLNNCWHPLVKHELTLVRDTSISSAVFREVLCEISQLLANSVTRKLPMSTRQIETPLMTMSAPVIGWKN